MPHFVTTALGLTSPLFRGRQAELARLIQLCQDEVSSYIVLYGGRQNGKTSLLLRLEAALAGQVHLCRIDFQLIKGAAAAEAVAFLAAQLAQAVQLPPARAVHDGPALLTYLEQTLERPAVTRCVLLLDEWGALPEATRQALANVLRAIFHTRLVRPALAKLQVLLSGGIELYDLVITEASSLHNICEEVYLADLAQAEAVALVADGLRSLGVDPTTAMLIGQAVYARVAGHPYLTQRIGSLFERAHAAGTPLTPVQVDVAVQHIRHGDVLLRRIRDDLREHGLEDAARTLLTAPPRFTRLDDALARLELIGLAKPDRGRWAPRNAMLAEIFRELLGLPFTPPLVWVPALVHVPAGPFLMGSSDADTLTYADQKPQHRLELPDFWIGRTPITNAQFRPFVESDGYTNSAYWTETGWSWRQGENITQPEYWDDAKWNGDTQPVVGISWFEAVAYCCWLSAQTGQEFRLPSEAEWEKAARGPDGRIWPWGNSWAAGRCNSKEAGVGRTTPVGQYPSGASPYGALDMAGNVWEWCATWWMKSYPYQLEDEWREAYLEADEGRVLRGGDYEGSQAGVRGAHRSFDNSRVRYDIIGLRVASRSPPLIAES